MLIGTMNAMLKGDHWMTIPSQFGLHWTGDFKEKRLKWIIKAYMALKARWAKNTHFICRIMKSKEWKQQGIMIQYSNDNALQSFITKLKFDTVNSKIIACICYCEFLKVVTQYK